MPVGRKSTRRPSYGAGGRGVKRVLRRGQNGPPIVAPCVVVAKSPFDSRDLSQPGNDAEARSIVLSRSGHATSSSFSAEQGTRSDRSADACGLDSQNYPRERLNDSAPRAAVTT
jgi:hypothetical protein